MILAFALLLAVAPEQAIRQVLNAQVAAWNRGDIPAFMSGYEDAATTTFVGSAVTKGFQPVLENYRKRYPTREKMGVLTFSDLEIRMLGSDHAAVLGRFHLKRTAEGGGDANGIFTLVFRNTDKGWKIIVDHTS